MADRLVERARSSRLLSSGWNGDEYNTIVDSYSDWGKIGADMVDAAGADKRLLAVQESVNVQIYDHVVTSSPEWRETLFYMLSLITMVKEIATKMSWQNDSALNILSSSTPTEVWHDYMVSGENKVHFLNDFDFHVYEQWWQSESSTFADPSSIKYWSVDKSEIMDNSLDGYFDMIFLPHHRFQDYSFEFIDALVDSLKPGGMMLLRSMAPRNFSYYQPMFLHAYPEHDYSRRIAEHPDLTSRHISWAMGFVLAYKNA